MRVPCALCGACLAYLRAQTTKLCCVPAFARHVGSRQAANRSAVHVEADTLHHHLHVSLLQTCTRAVIARIGTLVARFDARLIVFRDHGLAPSCYQATGIALVRDRAPRMALARTPADQPRPLGAPDKARSAARSRHSPSREAAALASSAKSGGGSLGLARRRPIGRPACLSGRRGGVAGLCLIWPVAPQPAAKGTAVAAAQTRKKNALLSATARGLRRRRGHRRRCVPGQGLMRGSGFQPRRAERCLMVRAATDAPSAVIVTPSFSSMARSVSTRCGLLCSA